MTDRPIGEKCEAKNRAGQPCARPAGWGTNHPGFGHCKLHGGSSPNGEKFAEKERAVWMDALLAQIDPSLQRIAELRDQEAVPAVALAAARDLLDRAGVKVTEESGAAALEVVVRFPD